MIEVMDTTEREEMTKTEETETEETETEDMTEREEMTEEDMIKIEEERNQRSMEDTNHGKDENGSTGAHTDSYAKIKIDSSSWTLKPRRQKSKPEKQLNTER